MTRSFHIDIEIDESKLDQESQDMVNSNLNKGWIEDAVRSELENEGINADVFAQDVKPD